MRVADSSTLKWEVISGHREGSIEFKRLLNGLEGRPDNYEFSLVKQEGAFHSPVHRHNFDQVRLPLSGRSSYAKNLYIHPGEVGYFPEGTWYGPQDIDETTETLVLQCGGPSGHGFLGYKRLHEGFGVLRERGRFEGGKFFPSGATEANEPKDSYEAIWELVNGRPLAYPSARFRNPIIMDFAAFDWRDVGGGVRRKPLGTFSERAVSMELRQLDGGARTALEPAGAIRLLFLLRGEIAAGESVIRAGSAVEIAARESAQISATDAAELLIISLPAFE